MIDPNKREGIPHALPFISDPQRLLETAIFDDATIKGIVAASRLYPFRIPLYYAGLIDQEDPYCPIRLQCLPTFEELAGGDSLDPLDEGSIRLTSCLLQRYPKRAVFLVCGECAMYCRFCNRRRMVGKGWKPELSRDDTLDYLEKDRQISEIILSGGDPMMLAPSELRYILERLRAISHIRTIRISSRLPVVFPFGIQEDHLKAIKKSSPVWFIVHINHPREITPEFLGVIRQLREAGAICLSQTVLLRKVNDCVFILTSLFERLVEAGVKPYYLFQLDDVAGTAHFKVRLKTGLEIIKGLRQKTSGLCIPHYALDITGGLGKVPLENRYLSGPVADGDGQAVCNLAGKIGHYRDNGEKSECSGCGVCGHGNGEGSSG